MTSLTVRVLTLYGRPALLASTLAGLIGCGGGGGGIGGGDQAPDPVVVDLPIAYIERPLARDEDTGELIVDTRDNRAEFRPGAQLVIKDRATEDAPRTVITDGLFAEGEPYDVRDLSVHPDGDRLLFALRAPEIEDADEEDQPTWNIWEYDRELESARRLISSDIIAGAADDISPRYLPSGRIAFSSTRQIRSRAILLDDNKPQYAAESEAGDGPAFVLHSMSAEGLDIRQLTYNQSHDWDPLVLDTGRLLYTRADDYANDQISYYTSRPDGTDVRPHYGYHSRTGDDTPWLFNPELLPDGRLVGIYKPPESLAGGDMLAIDTANYVEDNRSTDGETDVDAAESLTILPVTLEDGVSRHGRFAALAPLYDGTDRLLVSWSQCRLIEPATDDADERYVPCTDENLERELELAPPLFGLFTYDLSDNTQTTVNVPREDVIYTDIVTLEPRPAADYLAPRTDDDLAERGLGLLHIRSVYDIDGVDTSGPGIDVLRDPARTAPGERPARFLRLTKAVSLPPDEILDFDGSAFGAAGAQRMKEILGYVPIEPDGSVKALVPADVAFSLSVLDEKGRRISPRHQNWLQLRPGETFECKGCHQRGSTVPHGRGDVGPDTINAGAPTTGAPFANTEPALFADMGETMAEVYARIEGPREPNVNIEYTDDWTDPAVADKAADFAYRYANLSGEAEPEPEQVPASTGCRQSWNAQCRIVIHYLDHIQPLWERSRLLENEEGEIVADNTCTGCHSPEDADGLVRVPKGQLDLTDSANNSPHVTAYRQLLFTRFEQELVDGTLQDRLVETGEFETDEDGELILDEDGNPIPILERVPRQSPMSSGGARASARFFDRMETHDPDTGTIDHRGFLNPAELRLISEWLDIGAQYYNNPFDVPE